MRIRRRNFGQAVGVLVAQILTVIHMVTGEVVLNAAVVSAAVFSGQTTAAAAAAAIKGTAVVAVTTCLGN